MDLVMTCINRLFTIVQHIMKKKVVHLTSGGAYTDKPGNLMVIWHALEIHKSLLLMTIQSIIINLFVVKKVKLPLCCISAPHAKNISVWSKAVISLHIPWFCGIVLQVLFPSKVLPFHPKHASTLLDSSVLQTPKFSPSWQMLDTCITEEACVNTFLLAQLYIPQRSWFLLLRQGLALRLLVHRTSLRPSPIALRQHQCRLARRESLCAQLFTTQTSFNVSFRRN